MVGLSECFPFSDPRHHVWEMGMTTLPALPTSQVVVDGCESALEIVKSFARTRSYMGWLFTHPFLKATPGQMLPIDGPGAPSQQQEESRTVSCSELAYQIMAIALPGVSERGVLWFSRVRDRQPQDKQSKGEFQS